MKQAKDVDDWIKVNITSTRRRGISVPHKKSNTTFDGRSNDILSRLGANERVRSRSAISQPPSKPLPRFVRASAGSKAQFEIGGFERVYTENAKQQNQPIDGVKVRSIMVEINTKDSDDKRFEGRYMVAYYHSINETIFDIMDALYAHLEEKYNPMEIEWKEFTLKTKTCDEFDAYKPDFMVNHHLSVIQYDFKYLQNGCYAKLQEKQDIEEEKQDEDDDSDNIGLHVGGIVYHKGMKSQIVKIFLNGLMYDIRHLEMNQRVSVTKDQLSLSAPIRANKNPAYTKQNASRKKYEMQQKTKVNMKQNQSFKQKGHRRSKPHQGQPHFSEKKEDEVNQVNNKEEKAKPAFHNKLKGKLAMFENFNPPMGALKPGAVPPKRVKPRKRGNVGAKFGHLNINMNAFKPGAAPPKRKQEAQDIDHSAALNKTTINKQGRRKRTKKKLVLMDDDEPSAISASLFGANQ